MVSVAATVWVCAAWAVAVPVRAQSNDIAAAPAGQSVGEAIDLQAGPTCLEEERLERRVARWLKRDTIEAGLRIWVRGGPSENRVRFTLRRDGDYRTQRDLGEVPGDCGDRHAAVALAIALAIDAGQLGSLAEVEEEPAAPERSKLIMNAPAEPLWEPGLAISAIGGLGVGLLTAVAPAAAATVHIGFHQQFEVRLSGLWSGLFSHGVPGVSVKYDATVVAGSVGLCGVVRGVFFELATCGQMYGGMFRTESEGLASSGVVRSDYWAAGLGLDFRLRLSGPLYLRTGVDMILPFAAAKLVVLDAFGIVDKSQSLSPAAVFIGAGPMLRFF